MNRLLLKTAFFLFALTFLHQLAQAENSLELLWKAEGFEGPESVVYDSDREVLYVSNIAGDPFEKDGNGYISKVSLSGEIQEQKWVSGLDAPKGMGLWGDRLFVADIDTVVEIDLLSGKVMERYSAPGAKFLNDITVGEDGTVYISDMMANDLYQIQNKTLQKWLSGEKLDCPNGLYAESGRLVMGTWGKMTGEGFNTETLGGLKAIRLTDQDISPITSKPIGNCDGVAGDGEGNYWVSDWVAGKIFKVSANGDFSEKLQLVQGIADITVVDEEDVLLVPLMLSGALEAYRIAE